jgi:hypothetical protein
MKTIDVCNNQAGDITIHIPGSYLQHLLLSAVIDDVIDQGAEGVKLGDKV